MLKKFMAVALAAVLSLSFVVNAFAADWGMSANDEGYTVAAGQKLVLDDFDLTIGDSIITNARITAEYDYVGDAASPKAELWAEAPDTTWYDLFVDGWGVSTGFYLDPAMMGDAAIDMNPYAVFYDVGEYKVTIALVNVAPGVPATVAEVDIDVTVVSPFEVSDLDFSQVLTGESVTVPVTLKLSDDASYDKLRLGITGSGDAPFDLFATDSNGVKHNVFDYGFWGSDTGFAVPAGYSATTEFTTTLTTEGDYTITLELAYFDAAGVKHILEVKDFNIKAMDADSVDYSALEDIIEEANELNKDDYTAESYAKLVAAVIAGQDILDNKDTNPVTQEVVDSAISAIEAAMDGLVDVDDGQGGEGGEEGGTKKPGTPNTGVATSSIALISAIAAGGTMLVAKKRKK